MRVLVCVRERTFVCETLCGWSVIVVVVDFRLYLTLLSLQSCFCSLDLPNSAALETFLVCNSVMFRIDPTTCMQTCVLYVHVHAMHVECMHFT